jgi:hypothetical protein
MARIVATGKYLSDRITVEVTQEDGILVITTDGKEVEELQKHFDECVSKQPAMGGTYYPEPDSMLSAYNVMNNNFFDELEEITVDGDIGEIPYEENMIY